VRPAQRCPTCGHILPQHHLGCPGPQTVPGSDRGLAVAVLLYFLAIAALIRWAVPQ
jgi:hypothetical protein